MYGIVNKAIKGLVIENHGEAIWEEIQHKSGIDVIEFLTNEPYEDKVTYDLAINASEVLNIPLEEILFSFGEYWILKTGLESYGALMEAGGDNLMEFLENLPNFHSRVMLMFPNLKPPEFRVSDIKEKEINVHYYSERPGLQDFVKGLLSGLGKMYSTQVSIEMIASRNDGHDHDIFNVSW